jgi:hypothetical protein
MASFLAMLHKARVEEEANVVAGDLTNLFGKGIMFTLG